MFNALHTHVASPRIRISMNDVQQTPLTTLVATSRLLLLYHHPRSLESVFLFSSSVQTGVMAFTVAASATVRRAKESGRLLRLQAPCRLTPAN